MAITITITDPQDHAPYELRVLAEYFQALANDKQTGPDIYAEAAKKLGCSRAQAKTRELGKSYERRNGMAPELGMGFERTTHDEELLSDEERAALREGLADMEADRVKPIEQVAEELGIRASAGGDQEPYALNAGGSDDFAELRDDPKPDASTGAAASDGKTAQAASTPSLDSAGMPWDERIHSGSKSVNADGTWRYKRGGDLAERERIEAELKGARIAEAKEEIAGLPGGSGDFDPSDIPPPPVEDDVPPPPAEEDDVPPPPVEPVVEEVNSGMVFRAITAGQKGSLTQEAIMASLQAVGLTSTIDILKADQSVLVPLLALIEEASK